MSERLNLFDMNCLVGPPRKPTTVTPYRVSELAAELERFSISEALVGHHDALERGMHEGNAAVLQIAADDDRLTPVWALPMHSEFDFPNPEETVEDMLMKGVRAVRIPPSPYHGDLCSPWALGGMWSALERHRVPVMLDRTRLGVYPDQPTPGFTANNVHEICTAFPELPVVLLRVNFSAIRILIPLMRECSNLFSELSFFTVHRGVEVLAETVGTDRLLFGSGWPWGSPGPGIAAIRYSGLPTRQQQEIAGGNARRMLSAVRAT